MEAAARVVAAAAERAELAVAVDAAEVGIDAACTCSEVDVVVAEPSVTVGDVSLLDTGCAAAVLTWARLAGSVGFELMGEWADLVAAAGALLKAARSDELVMPLKRAVEPVVLRRFDGA